MKFSIITPVKNGEPFLTETIESVLNQRGDFEIEYILIDGGSADNTLKICKQYQTQIEQGSRNVFCNKIEVKIISQHDNSMYEGLSTGLNMANGEVIAYINADDFYLPNAFSCVADVFLKFPDIFWLTGLPARFNEKGQIIRTYFPYKYNTQLISKGFYGTELPFIQQESVFWRANLNKNLNQTDLRKQYLAGDFFLWHSFASEGFQLYILESVLSGNRIRQGQLSENRTKYFQEFHAIKSSSLFLDKILVLLYKLIEKFAGIPVKRRFSKNRVCFRKGNWQFL